LGQRHATLIVATTSKRPGSSADGPVYGAQIGCGSFVSWHDDPSYLGVIAYVLNVGTVRLQLPALPDRTPRIHALTQDLPGEVIALASSSNRNLLLRRNELAEAQFIRKFAASLRCCFGTSGEPHSVVDWYQQKLLPAALKLVPVEHQVNRTLSNAVGR
jgi:hypothetical protein